jgi:hypothetical protein
MPGSTHWFMPRAVCQVAASGLRLSVEQECMRIGPDYARPGLNVGQLRPPPPAWVIIKAWVRSGTLGPYCGRPGPHTGGSGSHSRGSVRTRGGPGPTWRFGPYIQGSDTLPWGSELTVDALEYITFSGHVAAPEPSMWWGRVLLLAQSSHPRLGRVTVWPHAQLLYHVTKVVRGTLV